MTKMFLKDFITVQRIKMSIIAFVVLTVMLSAFQLDKYSSPSAAGIIGIMICFFPTMYTMYAYAVIEHIRLYLTLPVSSKRTILSFSIALFVDTLLERMILVFAAVFFLFENPLPTIVFIFFSGFVTVLINVIILLGVNSKNFFTCQVGFLLFIGLIADCIFVSNLFIQIGIALFIGLVGILLMMHHDSINLAVSRQGAKSKRIGRNYFFNVLLSEKMYLLNTVVVLIFAGIFLFNFAGRGNPIMISIVWGLAAVNTPVTTMMSGDKSLIRQSEMLPDKGGAIMGMYRRFLIAYFFITNMIVLLLCFVSSGRFIPYLIIQFIAALAIEVVVTIFLETKKRITNWQTKQQLWRNPRKYITTGLVLVVNCIIGVIATM